jgi:hypothetical protein
MPARRVGNKSQPMSSSFALDPVFIMTIMKHAKGMNPTGTYWRKAVLALCLRYLTVVMKRQRSTETPTNVIINAWLMNGFPSLSSTRSATAAIVEVINGRKYSYRRFNVSHKDSLLDKGQSGMLVISVTFSIEFPHLFLYSPAIVGRFQENNLLGVGVIRPCCSGSGGCQRD